MSVDRVVVTKVEVTEVIVVAVVMGNLLFQNFGAQGHNSGYNARGRGGRSGRGGRGSYRDKCSSCGYGHNFACYAYSDFCRSDLP